MQIVNHQQGSQPWLDWRLGGIGSSDAIVIAAANGMVERKDWMASLDDLFEEKMTGVSKVIDNERMKRGRDGEAPARAAFELKTGTVVNPLCAEMDNNPRIRASFDGISFDLREFSEIKCPYDAVHELAKAGEIVDYYVPQVAHQSLVAWGHPSAWPDDAVVHFVTFVPETGDLAIVRKPASDLAAFATDLYTHELTFLDSLNSGIAPCGAEYADRAREYLAIDAQIKKLEKAKDELRAAMIAIAEQRGVSAIDGAGVSVAQQVRAGTIDNTKLYAHYSISEVEREKYRKKGTTFWQIRVDSDRVPANAEEVAERLIVPGAIEKKVASNADPFWSDFLPQQSIRKPATGATNTRARAS